MAYNVLIVDDSEIMRKIVARMLDLTQLPWGEVHHAGNGQEALQIAANNRLDLALVDLSMPIMNGVELIKRFRTNPATANVGIIVVSTEGSESRIEAIKQLGVGFIHKPIRPHGLRQAILERLGGSDAPQNAGSAA